MEAAELLKQVRKVEIKTRALTQGVFAGEYHSAFKGRGMSFSEVREYAVGDDVRDIDWNVTARLDRAHVKVYEEERELTVMLLIDVSSSGEFGTQTRTMRTLLAEMAATIAFSAERTGDKVGAILFSNEIVRFIPPKKGRSHLLVIVRELLTLSDERRKTDIGSALEFLTKTINKRCIAFLMSDFLDQKDYSDVMAIAARKHDVVALNVEDVRMSELPSVGLVRVSDAETGHEHYVDMGSKKVREWYATARRNHRERVEQRFLKSGIDYVNIRTDDDYVKKIIQLFSRRGNRK